MSIKKIQGVMTKKVITATPGETVKDVVNKLSKNNISGVPIVDDENRVVGMVSESDILQILKNKSRKLSLIFPSSHALGMTFEESIDFRELREVMIEVQNYKVEEVMNRDVTTVGPEKTIAEVSNIMVQNNINRIPVVKRDKIIGIITRGDIIKGLSSIF